MLCYTVCISLISYLDEIIWAKYRDLLLARNQLFCVWTGLLIFGFFEVKNWNDNFFWFVHPAVTDFGFCWEGFYNYLLFVCESFADSSKQIDRLCHTPHNDMNVPILKANANNNIEAARNSAWSINFSDCFYYSITQLRLFFTPIYNLLKDLR